jgi:hypothetical protein
MERFVLSILETVHESTRESIIYNKLKKGPVFKKAIKHIIQREPLVKEVRELITPAEEGYLYHVIIREHGARKTSLFKLAVNSIDEPKDVVYVDIPIKCYLQVDIAEAMRMALGWSLDQVINSSEYNYSSSLLVSIA